MSKYSLPQDGGLLLEGTPKDIIHRFEKIPATVYAVEREGVAYVAQQIIDAITEHQSKSELRTRPYDGPHSAGRIS